MTVLSTALSWFAWVWLSLWHSVPLFISACQIQALGVSSKDAFPDNSFSALSKSGSNVASKGRLNGIGAWSPSGNNNLSDFLQINLQYEFFICAVATQGKSTENHWTTKYKILLSLNNIDWVTYKENGTDKVGWTTRRDILRPLKLPGHIVHLLTITVL